MLLIGEKVLDCPVIVILWQVRRWVFAVPYRRWFMFIVEEAGPEAVRGGRESHCSALSVECTFNATTKQWNVELRCYRRTGNYDTSRASKISLTIAPHIQTLKQVGLHESSVAMLTIACKLSQAVASSWSLLFAPICVLICQVIAHIFFSLKDAPSTNENGWKIESQKSTCGKLLAILSNCLRAHVGNHLTVSGQLKARDSRFRNAKKWCEFSGDSNVIQ